jgi:hypothetical protein
MLPLYASPLPRTGNQLTILQPQARTGPKKDLEPAPTLVFLGEGQNYFPIWLFLWFTKPDSNRPLGWHSVQHEWWMLGVERLPEKGDF